jgi:mannose-1-phosphate guanylyltransferase
MSIGLIMAGGFGKRLWPESRIDYPKQLLSLENGESFLQAAYRRVCRLFGIEETYLVLREELKEKVLSQLPSVPPENIIVEPQGRDTAPCIGFASMWLGAKRGDVSMVVLPSDHFIRDENKFARVIQAAAQMAKKGHLVTIGIKPTRAETGYGYLELGKEMDQWDEVPIFEVERFTEKPSHKKAKEFFEQGNFLWNGGIFAWKSSVILQEIKKHLPKLHSGLVRIQKALGTSEEEKVIRDVYPSLPKISIDYGIMEKAKGVVAIRGDFFWDDIGNWQALERTFSKNGHGNIIRGLVEEEETSNCIFINREDKILGVIGVSDLIVINTENGVLVVRKEQAGKVRDLVDRLLADREKRKYL